MDSGYFYDFNNKKWQNVKNITYMATFNSKAYTPSSSISNKVLKHFHVIAQHYPKYAKSVFNLHLINCVLENLYYFSDSEIESIYTKLLYKHIFGDIENDSPNKEKV